MSQIEDITYAQGLRDSLSVMPDLMLIASCPSWHEKGSTWYYADPDLLVLGRVRPGMGTFYAESGNRQFGEYLDADAAKRAVERYYGDKAA